MKGWKKILIPVFVLVLISMVACLLGCDLLSSSTASPQKGIVTTRFQDIKGGVIPPIVNNFGTGDLPCVYVHGYGGNTVTVEVYNVSTGLAVQGTNKKTDFIPEGLNAWWEYPNLPSATYKAVLYVGGVQEKSATFTVGR